MGGEVYGESVQVKMCEIGRFQDRTSASASEFDFIVVVN